MKIETKYIVAEAVRKLFERSARRWRIGVYANTVTTLIAAGYLIHGLLYSPTVTDLVIRGALLVALTYVTRIVWADT